MTFIIPSITLKSFKWLLVVEEKNRISLKNAVIARIAGFSAGVVTPGRAGDFLRAKFLKVRLGKSLLTVFVDRINDVLVLFLLGIFSVFIF